jgi:S-adenosylmethionine synthetase
LKPILCGILSAIHEQSADINQGVDRANPEDQGAGDQGNDVWLCY